MLSILPSFRSVLTRASLLSVAGLLWLASSAPASAAIIVSFGTSSPNPLIAGSSGLIDVFVATDAGSQLLDGFLVELEITGGPAGGLVFSLAQPDAQLTDPNYAFFGVSNSFNTGVPVGVVLGGGSIYSGSDITDDGTGPPPLAGGAAPITLTTASRLLYRLDLTAVTAGIYTIDVDAINSGFLDDLGGSILFSSQPGSITAVPEPTTFTLLAVGTATAAAIGRRRRRHTALERVRHDGA